MPQLAVSQFTTMPRSWSEDLQAYRAAGVGLVEVCEAKLPQDGERAEMQLARLLAAGMRVSSVQARVHAVFPDGQAPRPEPVAERVERFHRSIDLFGRALPGSGVPLVLISGAAPGRDLRAGWETLRQVVPELVAHAAERGLRIGIEALHPVLMHTDTFVWRLEEARELVAAVDHEACGLIVDLWNLFWDRDIAQRIAQVEGDRIFGVHVADWWREGPRGIADRALPGDGIVDLPRLLAAVHATGYRGPYALEVLSDERLPDSLWRRDPVDVVRRGLEGIRSAWRAAELPEEEDEAISA